MNPFKNQLGNQSEVDYFNFLFKNIKLIWPLTTCCNKYSNLNNLNTYEVHL